MNLQDFEQRVRDVLEQILNHLQSANLLSAQVSPESEAEIQTAGRLVRELSLLIEEFITEQRSEQDG